jgi:hypothetical protein
MRRWSVPLGLVLVLVGAQARSAAPPRDVVQAFIQLCGETHGDATAALARADALGWTIPTKPVSRLQVADLGTPVSRNGRVWTGETQTWALLVGAIGGNAEYRDCSVGTVPRRGAPPPDFAAMRGALEAWVGGPPMAKHDLPAFTIFAFADGPGGRQRLPSGYDPLANDATRAEGVATVMLETFRGVAIMVYQTPAS